MHAYTRRNHMADFKAAMTFTHCVRNRQKCRKRVCKTQPGFIDDFQSRWKGRISIETLRSVDGALHIA